LGDEANVYIEKPAGLSAWLRSLAAAWGSSLAIDGQERGVAIWKFLDGVFTICHNPAK
jgi:hypothetical protein